ncbi:MULTISPECIES: hypothetical protein [Streptomyces]|uniref:DUF3892 domain-containing protein n=1 Tax=Streptomyces evansiae TaxID=3075535 RepID=A0ABU2R2I8_9ACTN|nr:MULTISPECIES: hypothetical protein [unclassified Streptomyces]MDT0409925.1 hypothetical protein [Streptomyces sp. DSM 41979]MYQ59988.1 hypothetical protein [Streptomyces sp. SID4926]SCE40491.1 hypothetical protein GA0115252_146437 [Streptomyces sp. DfronAA-171]
MATIYQRTENGTTTTVPQAEGLAEINHAMMGGRRQVRTMSSITRTDYDITYKDGRNVRLTLIDNACGNQDGRDVCTRHDGHPGPHRNSDRCEPQARRWVGDEERAEADAPHFSFGDLVMTDRGPGKVARVISVPRSDATRITRYTVELDGGGEIDTHESGVRPVEPQATESPARPNLQTHTGVVHASGARTKALPVGRAPKCCASRSALARYHFLIPTEQAVTCRRCLAALAKEASRS